jgi:hypothetical protein
MMVDREVVKLNYQDFARKRKASNVSNQLG